MARGRRQQLLNFFDRLLEEAYSMSTQITSLTLKKCPTGVSGFDEITGGGTAARSTNADMR